MMKPDYTPFPNRTPVYVTKAFERNLVGDKIWPTGMERDGYIRAGLVSLQPPGGAPAPVKRGRGRPRKPTAPEAA